MRQEPQRILLIDVDDEGREVLAARLRAQGFLVDTAPDGATGAALALASPPSTVIADLWMPGISGVQLCRLLNGEAATADVPLILRAEQDDPKSRFWAERAGAVALISKGRMGELVRVLKRVLTTAPAEGGFFTHLGGSTQDIRDRIAEHLDSALFESVIAAEVRALATASSFDWLFDSFSQLTSQLMTYHWLAIVTSGPARMAVHAHPRSIEAAEAQARTALGMSATIQAHRVADKDAAEQEIGITDPRVVIRDIPFGAVDIARIAVAPTTSSVETDGLVSLIARELGGVIKIATLVEDSQRLATTDSLTGLMNRRAFVSSVEREVDRADRTDAPLSVLLLDVDHFKHINDRLGHATGDVVLAALGTLLPQQARQYDVVARWGGEEFVLALPNAGGDDARNVAERMRRCIAESDVRAPNGDRVPVTVSIGVAERRHGESLDSMLDRADCAMYAAKTGGRNRVNVAPTEVTSAVVVEEEPASSVASTTAIPVAAPAPSPAPAVAPPAVAAPVTTTSSTNLRAVA